MIPRNDCVYSKRHTLKDAAKGDYRMNVLKLHDPGKLDPNRKAGSVHYPR